MTSVNLEKNIEYLKIQEKWLKIWQSVIYLKEYFYVFLYPERYQQAQSKTNHWIS